MDIKKCSTCGEEKNPEKFFDRGKGKDHKCKTCRLAYNRDRYAKTIAPYRKKYTYGEVEVKRCKVCGLEKPVSEFVADKSKGAGPSKYRPECKTCQKTWRDTNKEKLKEEARLYRIQNKEKIKERKRKFLSDPANLEKNRQYAREYQRNHPEMQRKRILSKYGITIEKYDELLQTQNGGCAICGRTENGRKKNFIVDHDHKTEKVRGLLCTQCNAGLGNFRDDPSLLQSAIDYLRRY
jgi:hypothetical protein